MNNCRNLIMLFIFLVTVSCKNKERAQFDFVLNEWQGKEIIFPESLKLSSMLDDRIESKIPSSKYKILIYTDSSGCTGCKLQLDKWKKLISNVNLLSGDDVSFLFIFNPSDLEGLAYLFQSEEFDYPVCIDYDDLFNKANQLPLDISYQTFLLDEKNHVLTIGNPIYDGSVQEKYMEIISGKKASTKKLLKTNVEIENTDIELSTFNKSESKEITIKVQNSGDNSLVITHVNTTCGCIEANYDKNPVQPGGFIEIKLTIKSNDIGFFNKTVTIGGNIDTPIKIQLKGNVV